MLTIPPGEPDLYAAILKAAKSKGASYVCQYEGVSGWNVRDSLPRTAAYFRVSCDRVSVHSLDGQEVYFGRIVDGRIVREGAVENVSVEPKLRGRQGHLRQR